MCACVHAHVCSEVSVNFTPIRCCISDENDSLLRRTGIWWPSTSSAIRRRVCGTGEARKTNCQCATPGRDHSVDLTQSTPTWRTKRRTSFTNFTTLPGTEQAIQYKAVELAHHDSLPQLEFKSSKTVGPLFYEAKGICSSSAVIHLPQKQPDSYEDKLISFQRYDTRLREERMFPIQIKNRH